MNFTSCTQAAAAGDIEAVRILRREGLEWSEFTCSEAAYGGHLTTLQWLRAQNPPCPLDMYSALNAAEGGQLAVLCWLYAEGAPFGSTDYPHPNCAEFMAADGALWARGIYAHSVVKPAKKE